MTISKEKALWSRRGKSDAYLYGPEDIYMFAPDDMLSTDYEYYHIGVKEGLLQRMIEGIENEEQ